MNKKRKFVPLDPQPSPNQILLLQKNYTTLKISDQYSRRVTWIAHAPVSFPVASMQKAIYEYLGTYPGHSVHGNAKHIKRPYNRCPAQVMEKINKLNKCVKPKAVYKQINKENEESERPMDIKQISNIEKVLKKARRRLVSLALVKILLTMS